MLTCEGCKKPIPDNEPVVFVNVAAHAASGGRFKPLHPLCSPHLLRLVPNQSRSEPAEMSP